MSASNDSGDGGGEDTSRKVKRVAAGSTKLSAKTARPAEKKAAVKTPIKAPIKAPAKAPVKASTKAPAKAPAKSAFKPGAKSPARLKSGGASPARRAPQAPSRPRGPREDYPTVQAFIAIGANLGDAEASVKSAMEAIATIERTVVTAKSSLYRSEPVDATGPDFINAVIAVRTGLTAEALLEELQLLEEQAGRERPFPNAPRTLDLDLLLHGASIKDGPKLTLPHPRMRDRAFVLKPLAEIAPDKVPRVALSRVSSQVCKRIV